MRETMDAKAELKHSAYAESVASPARSTYTSRRVVNRMG